MYYKLIYEIKWIMFIRNEKILSLALYFNCFLFCNVIHFIKQSFYFLKIKWFWFLSSGDALSKAELQKAELELEINKAKTEEATLKDALLKMQAMNEGLGQDKVELNKIIMQVTTHPPSS